MEAPQIVQEDISSSAYSVVEFLLLQKFYFDISRVLKKHVLLYLVTESVHGYPWKVFHHCRERSSIPMPILWVVNWVIAAVKRNFYCWSFEYTCFVESYRRSWSAFSRMIWLDRSCKEWMIMLIAWHSRLYVVPLFKWTNMQSHQKLQKYMRCLAKCCAGPGHVLTADKELAMIWRSLY